MPSIIAAFSRLISSPLSSNFDTADWETFKNSDTSVVFILICRTAIDEKTFFAAAMGGRLLPERQDQRRLKDLRWIALPWAMVLPLSLVKSWPAWLLNGLIL